MAPAATWWLWLVGDRPRERRCGERGQRESRGSGDPSSHEARPQRALLSPDAHRSWFPPGGWGARGRGSARGPGAQRAGCLPRHHRRRPGVPGLRPQGCSGARTVAAPARPPGARRRGAGARADCNSLGLLRMAEGLAHGSSQLEGSRLPRAQGPPRHLRRLHRRDVLDQGPLKHRRRVPQRLERPHRRLARLGLRLGPGCPVGSTPPRLRRPLPHAAPLGPRPGGRSGPVARDRPSPHRRQLGGHLAQDRAGPARRHPGAAHRARP